MQAHRQSTVLPIIPPQIMTDIFRTIRVNRAECWAEWVVEISARSLSDERRQRLLHLFSFILNNFEEIAENEISFTEKFKMQVFRSQPAVTGEDIIFLLASLESIVMSIIWKNSDNAKAELTFRWIHSVAVKLESAIIENTYFPLQATSVVSATETWEQPLVRFLNWFNIGRYWTWISLVRVETDVKIVDIALYDNQTNRWTNAMIDEALFQDVLDTNAHGGGYRVQIASGLFLVAKGTPSDSSWLLFQRTIQLLEITSNLFGNMRDLRLRNDKLFLYETLLELDDVLTTAVDAQKIFEFTTSYVCQFGNFARGALFLYSPFSRTVEGMYSYNIQLEDVRRIRDNERSFPLLYHLSHLGGCVFYPDVSHKFPVHYVRQFQLTSLLICPMLDNQNKLIGILLLDQAGKTFQPDPRSITMVNAMLQRSAKILSARLYQSHSSKPTLKTGGRLTSREQEVLQCIADGMDTKEMAKHLYISEHTVTEHVSSALKKLVAKNRAEAVAIGIREHFIT